MSVIEQTEHEVAKVYSKEQIEHEVAKVYSKEQRLAALTATVLPHDCRRWLRLSLLTLLVCLFIEAVSS